MSDQFDIDAILASVTDPKSPANPSKTSKDANSSLFDDDGSGFKIDPRDAHITGVDQLHRDNTSVSVNPEDFENQVETNRHRRRKIKLYIALAAALFLAVLGTVIYTFIPIGPGNSLEQPRPPATTVAESPFTALYPNAPAAPTDTALTANADKTGVWLNDGERNTFHLTFAGMDFTATDKSVVKTTEFGLMATAGVKGKWSGTQIYAFKDMVHSTVMGQGWDRAIVKVDGSPAAGVMYLELAGEVHAVLAIVNPDSSGFLIVLPEDLNYASAENLAQFVRVE